MEDIDCTTRPLNIYLLSRIQSQALFRSMLKHATGRECSRVGSREITSLRKFVDKISGEGLPIEGMDGFFYSYHIPYIGKEFDLLKFTDSLCINIELKSENVGKEVILDQLVRNRHYLAHIPKRKCFFSVVTNSMTCYKLGDDGGLERIELSEIVTVLKHNKNKYVSLIDDMFRAVDYLVSPLNSPERFLNGEYFLTQNQEEFKKKILDEMERSCGGKIFHITGEPGTGKTLLLYDLAKDFAKNGLVLIVHCGKVVGGQRTIMKRIKNIEIVKPADITDRKVLLFPYKYIIVDEAQRIYSTQFNEILESVVENKQTCILASDQNQVLSVSETKENITSRIRELPLSGDFTLSKRIRTNNAMNSFIECLMDLKHKPRKRMDYSCVEINYANNQEEAYRLLGYYRDKEYVFINFSKTNYGKSPYSIYPEDFDTHHVIGQEFDRVVILLDKSFFYDADGKLQGIRHPNPNYLYVRLLYQEVTRVRERLSLVIVENIKLFEKVVSIVDSNE